MEPIPSASLPAKSPFYLWGEVSSLALIAMEVIWVSLWYETLLKWPAPWEIISLLLLGVILVSYLIARGMNMIKINPWLRLTLFIAWSVACLLASLKWMIYPQEAMGVLNLLTQPILSFLLDVGNSGPFWHIVIVLLLISRGATLSRKPVDLWDIQSSFQIGLLMLLFFGVTNALVNRAQSVLPVFGFIFFGLIAMVTARISIISVLRGGRLPALSRNWWISIFSAALVVVGLGIFLGWIFSGNMSEIMSVIIKIMLGLLALITFLLLAPIIPVLKLLTEWIGSSANSLFSPQFTQVFQSIVEEMQQSNQQNGSKVLEWITMFSPWFLGALMLLILLWAASELGWLPWKRQFPEEAGTENLAFKPGLRRLFQPRPKSATANPARLYAAARIRRVYYQLLKLSEKLGAPRPAAATPLEFLPVLTQILPTVPDELTLITQAYNQIRYGLLPESEDEVQQIMDAWEAVRAAGKPALQSKRKQDRSAV